MRFTRVVRASPPAAIWHVTRFFSTLLMKEIGLPPPHPASLEVEDLLAQCRLSTGRSSGPGGQHRNKVETKVTIVHVPSNLEAHASERRSQAENRSVAITRLRLCLAVNVRCPVGSGECRTDLWRSRCNPSGRISCNPEHQDYPGLLSLALDVLAAMKHDPRKAAARLCCSPSQLIRLVKDHPPALVRLNAARAERGLHALH